MKIVLDTNCLLRAVPDRSEFNCILTALQRGYYTLCFSNDILIEYEEMLIRFYSNKITEDILNFIFYSPNALMVTPYFQWYLISNDPDDNKFVDCALNAGADYIVTNDQHFNILKSIKFPPIKVISMEIFKNILKL